MIPRLRRPTRCARRKRNNLSFSVKPVQGTKDLKILYIRDSTLISSCRGPWQTFFYCIRCNLSYTTLYSLPSPSQLENGAKQCCVLYSTNTSFLIRYYETSYDYKNFSLVLLSLKFGNSQTGTLRFACLYTYNKTAGFLPMWSSINHLLLSNLLYIIIIRRGVELQHVDNKHSALVFSNPCHSIITVILFLSA